MTSVTEVSVEPVAVTAAQARKRRAHLDPKVKTAVLLVSGFNGTGLHTLFNVRKVFGDVSATGYSSRRHRRCGPVQGVEGLNALRPTSTKAWTGTCASSNGGIPRRGYSAVGTDVSDESADWP